jgi:AcrR family transcriptional regulator
VKVAGELLGEVGFEKLTSNAICARASVTPPAFYHYFNDKYEILEELAERLLKKQNDAYAIWLVNNGSKSTRIEHVKALEDWFRQAAAIVANEPGAFWTMRAMRALPNLAHMRLESQRLFTDQMVAFARRILPDVAVELLWYRLRIVAEFGFTIDELALEEDKIPREALFREAARLIQGALEEMARKTTFEERRPAGSSAPSD